jgi:putative OPT family oligopeptide transporter
MRAQQDTQPELTARAIILAMVLAVVLGSANTYLGLFAGLTIASAIPAAVVSMGVLKILGRGGILENTMVATGASAGTSIPSGVIFTLPALVMLGYWTDFKYSWVLAIAGLGGILGVLFSVPLRRSLLVEQGLAFPEGKAAAEVLKTGEHPERGLKLLSVSALAGGVVKLIAGSGLRLIPDTAIAAGFAGKWLLFTSANLSPALLGVGYIVGLNIGFVMVVGALFSWNIAIPIYHAYYLTGNPELAAAVAGASAADAGYAIWAREIRYIGVGAMLIGGVWTFISLRRSILSGIRSGLAVARSASDKVVPRTEQDLPMKAVLVGVVLFTLPLLVLYQVIVGSFVVSLPMAIIMILAGFLFCSVAAYMAGMVGSSNNPVSGITIATILFAAAVLVLLMGPTAELGPIAAIMIGAVVCCAASVAGDNLQDLKSGQLVGATPWRQQVMLAVGAVSASLVMAPVLNLLAQAYGIGAPTPEHPNPLTAPQATLMAAVAKGMFGGHLPWTMVGIGAVIGVITIAIDEMFKARKSTIRVPVLAAALGIYLPLEYLMPIFIGGLLAHLVERRYPERDKEQLHRRGTLFAGGLITGESLMGIIIAIPIVTSGRGDVLALPESLRYGQWLGLIIVAIIGLWLYRTAAAVDPHAVSEART